MLERVTKAGFFNNQFIEVHNTATTSSETATTRVFESIKKDSRLNGYDPDVPTTIRVPRFTFDIISCLPFAQQQSSSSSSLSPQSYGSGAFDLAQSLELLPSQEYGLLLPMVEVEVDKVGRYNDRYCGYLSRQGLVFLASRYARRVSMNTGPSGGIVIDTSLGRFKVFEHDHRTYVHFDSGMRTLTVPVSSPSDIGPDVQPDMEAIRKAADGRYFARDLYVEVQMIGFTTKEWKEPGPVPTIKTAILNVFQDLECSVFLPSGLAREWEMLAKFSSDILQSVSLIFLDIQEPKRLVQLRDIFFEGMRRKDQSFGGHATDDDRVEQSLVMWGYTVKVGSGSTEGFKVLADMKSDEMHKLILDAFGSLCKGHAKFRGATIDSERLIETSDKRFLSLFEAYRAQPSMDRLHGELRKLLHKSENICLVLWQAVLAMLTYRNACKVLRFGIESPDEWIQFILAQDSDILIG